MSNHSLGALSESLAGRYTVERELGAGGMATVYLAHDLRHDRRVALKVLRPELAAVIGAERFLREIRTTANLQHPHILPLFDSGEAGAQLFYVMPLVEGESLRDRLDHEKQLGVEESVRIATEVASALDYAHRHGVVHRDVKPANILLHDGSALVTDFGIALAIRNAGADRITETGLSLGTPHYMSPEQATGDRDIGARSDIYSLAAVLYECLAGEPPHSGGTIQAVIAKVLTEIPRPLGDLRGSVPVHVAIAVEQALAKVPADRFATAAAFADALKNPSATVSRTIGTTSARRAPAPGSRTLAAMGLAGIALGALLGWSLRKSEPPAPPAVVWFDIVADSGLNIADAPIISPDGSTLIYSAGGTGGSALYLRRLDELNARRLSGTEGAHTPFFSPDGKSVAFVSNTELRTLRLDGGAPVSIGRISQFFMGGTWAPDNTILYTQFPQTGLYRVNVSGGTVERIGFANPDSAGVPGNLSMLPGGDAILVSIDYGQGITLASFDLATGSVKRLGRGTSPQFVAPHWLVFGRDDGRLFKQRFNVATRDTVGSPEPILNGVNFDQILGTYYFGVGPDGTLAVVTGASSISDLTLVDLNGGHRVLFSANNTWAPRFSPDGRRIAYGAIAPGKLQSDVWVYELATGNSQRLTLEGNDSNDPMWSPDGREIMFSATRDSIKDLYVQSVDDIGSARLVARRPGLQWNSDWSRDGRSIVFTDIPDGGSWNIWSMTVGDTASARSFLSTSFQETAARLSPDGKWIAYNSDETGRLEVYVQSFPAPGNRMLVSSNGGRDPAWRFDGRELYYWQSNQLIAATLTTARTISVSRRVPLFEMPTYVLGAHANYDVSPDGRSFAIVSGAVASRVSVGLNFVR